MNESPAETGLRGKLMLASDDVALGEIEAETETHIRLRVAGSDLPGGQLWIPKEMVRAVEGDRVRLDRARADLHDAVLAMPPGQQREYATLNLSAPLGRRRGLGHTAR